MKNLFVGNLSFRATESDLRTLFEGFGVVERVNLVTDLATGRSRGFAFVEMSDDEAAAQAMAGLNSKEFQGRALNVSEARPRAERGGGGGRRDDRKRRGSSRPSREPRW